MLNSRIAGLRRLDTAIRLVQREDPAIRLDAPLVEGLWLLRVRRDRELARLVDVEAFADEQPEIVRLGNELSRARRDDGDPNARPRLLTALPLVAPATADASPGATDAELALFLGPVAALVLGVALYRVWRARPVTFADFLAQLSWEDRIEAINDLERMNLAETRPSDLLATLESRRSRSRPVAGEENRLDLLYIGAWLGARAPRADEQQEREEVEGKWRELRSAPANVDRRVSFLRRHDGDLAALWHDRSPLDVPRAFSGGLVLVIVATNGFSVTSAIAVGLYAAAVGVSIHVARRALPATVAAFVGHLPPVGRFAAQAYLDSAAREAGADERDAGDAADDDRRDPGTSSTLEEDQRRLAEARQLYVEAKGFSSAGENTWALERLEAALRVLEDADTGRLGKAPQLIAEIRRGHTVVTLREQLEDALEGAALAEDLAHADRQLEPLREFVSRPESLMEVAKHQQDVERLAREVGVEDLSVADAPDDYWNTEAGLSKLEWTLGHKRPVPPGASPLAVARVKRDLAVLDAVQDGVIPDDLRVVREIVLARQAARQLWTADSDSHAVKEMTQRLERQYHVVLEWWASTFMNVATRVLDGVELGTGWTGVLTATTAIYEIKGAQSRKQTLAALVEKRQDDLDYLHLAAKAGVDLDEVSTRMAALRRVEIVIRVRPARDAGGSNPWRARGAAAASRRDRGLAKLVGDPDSRIGSRRLRG